MTQLSNAFAPTSISKNGTSVGSLTSVEVDANGYVRASFDSGINRILYQIPLVDVPNVNGLEAMDRQTYAVTPDSGTFFMWDAGDGPTGDLVGYAREESTTDVAGELTNLIQTQRAYSSNAKVIQTVALSIADATDLPVEIMDWVLPRSELMDLSVWSATIAPLFVKILDMVHPWKGRFGPVQISRRFYGRGGCRSDRPDCPVFVLNRVCLNVRSERSPNRPNANSVNSMYSD